jgi:hypothetical protein
MNTFAAEMKLVVCDTGPKAEMLVKAASRMPSLKVLVVIQEKTLTNEIIEEGKNGRHCSASFHRDAGKCYYLRFTGAIKTPRKLLYTEQKSFIK